MLSRKQIWRRVCSNKNENKKIYDKKYYFIEEQLLDHYNNNIEPNKKKVRFNNIVHATLIPTREELDNVYRLYSVKLSR